MHAYAYIRSRHVAPDLGELFGITKISLNNNYVNQGHYLRDPIRSKTKNNDYVTYNKLKSFKPLMSARNKRDKNEK